MEEYRVTGVDFAFVVLMVLALFCWLGAKRGKRIAEELEFSAHVRKMNKPRAAFVPRAADITVSPNYPTMADMTELPTSRGHTLPAATGFEEGLFSATPAQREISTVDRAQRYLAKRELS